MLDERPLSFSVGRGKQINSKYIQRLHLKVGPKRSYMWPWRQCVICDAHFGDICRVDLFRAECVYQVRWHGFRDEWGVRGRKEGVEGVSSGDPTECGGQTHLTLV